MPTCCRSRNAPGIVLKPITVGRWYFLQWHVNEPPFDNPKLRQAFAHAIDRNRLNEITMRGQGMISDGPTPPGLWWYDPDLKSYPHDPARAKALLAEAGHPNGFEYVLSTPQVSVFQQINQLLQEQLGAVGIKLTLQPAAASEWYARVVSGATNLTPTRWTQRADPDGLLYILFHSKGFANTMKYRNEQVDALLDQARTVYDMHAQEALRRGAAANRRRSADGAIAVRRGIRGVRAGEWLPVDSRPDPALPRSVESGCLNRRLQHGPGSAWPPWMPNLDQSRGMFHRAIDTLYPPRWFDA